MLCCYRDDRKRKKRVSLLIVTTAVTASRFLLVKIQLTSVRSCTHCERSGSTTYNNNCNFNAYPTFYNIGTSFALSMGARLFLRMHYIFYRIHGIPDNEGKPLTGRHSCAGWHRRSGTGSCAVVAAVIKTATRRPPHHVLKMPGTRHTWARVLCLKCRITCRSIPVNRTHTFGHNTSFAYFMLTVSFVVETVAQLQLAIHSNTHQKNMMMANTPW